MDHGNESVGGKRINLCHQTRELVNLDPIVVSDLPGFYPGSLFAGGHAARILGESGLFDLGVGRD
jgi:hypothetical protein